MSVRSTIAPFLLIASVAGCDRQVSQPEQAVPGGAPAANATALTDRAPKEGDKVLVDTIGTLDRSHKGDAASPVMFEDEGGKPTGIAAFKGKPVLVNLWATWCGPCVKEMPTLDAAAAAITIATVSQDKDRATVDGYFAKAHFTRLKPYLDSELGLSIAYNASLPTSILFDSTGHEVWRMVGGMDWTSATARELLAEAR